VYKWSRSAATYRWRLRCNYWSWPKETLEEKMSQLSRGDDGPVISFCHTNFTIWLVEVRTAAIWRSAARQVVRGALGVLANETTILHIRAGDVRARCNLSVAAVSENIARVLPELPEDRGLIIFSDSDAAPYVSAVETLRPSWLNRTVLGDEWIRMQYPSLLDNYKIYAIASTIMGWSRAQLDTQKCTGEIRQILVRSKCHPCDGRPSAGHLVQVPAGHRQHSEVAAKSMRKMGWHGGTVASRERSSAVFPRSDPRAHDRGSCRTAPCANVWSQAAPAAVPEA
jgi:hypothetical protein